MKPQDDPGPVPAFALAAPAKAKRRRSGVGWALRLTSLAVAIVALAVIAVQIFPWSPTCRGRNSSGGASALAPKVASGASAASKSHDNPTSTEASANLPALLESVVLIEANSPAGRRVIGSGFVVDSSGLVATCLHVASEATEAAVRFHDGRLFDVVGYAAVSREHDLAVLVVKSAGVELRAAELELDPPAPLSAVVALGHPQGIAFAPSDGRVSLVLSPAELSSDSRQFLKLLTGTETAHSWIQHTARLSDGNSGGPLFDAAGRVIGVNTWVDRQTGFSYALPSAELAKLLASTFDEPQPLEQYATADARQRAAIWNATSEQLKQWHEQAKAMRWRPESEADYRVLQQLAWTLTLAHNPDVFAARGALAPHIDALTRQADQIVAGLRREKWDDIGQITLLNEQASTRLFQPSSGVFAFVTLERIVTGADGKRAAIMQLAGFDQPLLVPLDNPLQQPEPGSQWLLVGVNQRGQTVRYGDNPLQPTIAPIIVAPVLVPLEP